MQPPIQPPNQFPNQPPGQPPPQPPGQSPYQSPGQPPYQAPPFPQPPIPPPYGYPHPVYPKSPEQLLKEERNWAMACHLASLSAYVGVPFGNVIGPLIVWSMKKDQFPLVADQGKEAVNFGILLTILGLLAFLLVFVLIGIPALIALPLIHLYFSVVAAMRASEGEAYRYPFNFPFVK